MFGPDEILCILRIEGKQLGDEEAPTENLFEPALEFGSDFLQITISRKDQEPQALQLLSGERSQQVEKGRAKGALCAAFSLIQRIDDPCRARIGLTPVGPPGWDGEWTGNPGFKIAAVMIANELGLGLVGWGRRQRLVDPPSRETLADPWCGDDERTGSLE